MMILSTLAISTAANSSIALLSTAPEMYELMAYRRPD